MHGLQACLFKYITVAAFGIYLSMVKMLLKGEVGGNHLKVMKITLLIMENHGIVFMNFCGKPDITMIPVCLTKTRNVFVHHFY